MSKKVMMMYIDSNNFYKNVQELYSNKSIRIDWFKAILGLRNIIQNDYECSFSKAYYYSALSDRNDNPEKFDKHKAFLDYLDRIPFIDTVIGKLSRIPRNQDIPIDKNDPSTYRHIEKILM